MNKQLFKNIFTTFVSLVTIELLVIMLVHIPILHNNMLMIAILCGYFLTDKVKRLVSKLPGLK